MSSPPTLKGGEKERSNFLLYDLLCPAFQQCFPCFRTDSEVDQPCDTMDGEEKADSQCCQSGPGNTKQDLYECDDYRGDATNQTEREQEEHQSDRKFIS